jgi:hypothetical protein
MADYYESCECLLCLHARLISYLRHCRVAQDPTHAEGHLPVHLDRSDQSASVQISCEFSHYHLARHIWLNMGYVVVAAAVRVAAHD